MKTSTLISRLENNNPANFITKVDHANVTVARFGSEEFKVYIGDGDAPCDYQVIGAAGLRELAKKFKAMAELVDPTL